MQVIKQAKQAEGKQAIPLNLPESCLACHTLNVASFPVKLTQLDGSVITVCHVARCVNCGYVKKYGIYKVIFKFNNGRPDFGMRYWTELKRNGITPDAFIEAVCEASKKQGPVLRTIWLDARNGLKQATATGKYYEIMRKWEGLINARRRF